LSQAPEQVEGEHPRKCCVRTNGAPLPSTQETSSETIPCQHPPKAAV
jgi:hypothetical protein